MNLDGRSLAGTVTTENTRGWKRVHRAEGRRGRWWRQFSFWLLFPIISVVKRRRQGGKSGAGACAGKRQTLAQVLTPRGLPLRPLSRRSHDPTFFHPYLCSLHRLKNLYRHFHNVHTTRMSTGYVAFSVRDRELYVTCDRRYDPVEYDVLCSNELFPWNYCRRDSFSIKYLR